MALDFRSGLCVVSVSCIFRFVCLSSQFEVSLPHRPIRVFSHCWTMPCISIFAIVFTKYGMWKIFSVCDNRLRRPVVDLHNTYVSVCAECICVIVLECKAHTSHRAPRAIERIVAKISHILSVVALPDVVLLYRVYSIKQSVFLYGIIIIIIMIPRIALDALCCVESVWGEQWVNFSIYCCWVLLLFVTQ